MQDRFKFRIFDKKLNKISNWGDNPYHNMEIVNMICSDNPEYNSDNNFSIMQCTGLKDKNGKLIFEGDIVDILPEVETTGIIKWSDDLARFVIVYENIQCDFDNYYGYELEVIGNIYENPELLESEEQCEKTY